MKDPLSDQLKYRVDLLDFGRMPRCPRSGVQLFASSDEYVPWAYTGLLLRGGGKTILVNTGFPDDLGPVQQAFHAWSSEATLQRGEEQTLAGQLARLGVEPSEVDHLLLSCLGPYSTGAIGLIEGCAIHLGRAEWVDHLAPPPNFPPQPYDTILPPATLRRMVTTDRHRLRLLEDEDELAPGTGIRVFRTGGHHHGSLAIKILTARGWLIYADTVFTYENYEQNLTPGFLRSQDAVHAAYARIQREADVVLPFFDPAAFQRYPDQVVAEL